MSACHSACFIATLFNSFFNRCTVHFEIYVVHSPINTLFINLVKSFKFINIIVYFNLNLKLLTKLINSAFVGV